MELKIRLRHRIRTSFQEFDDLDPIGNSVDIDNDVDDAYEKGEGSGYQSILTAIDILTSATSTRMTTGFRTM